MSRLTLILGNTPVSYMKGDILFHALMFLLRPVYDLDPSFPTFPIFSILLAESLTTFSSPSPCSVLL